jgi:hypothetical protein
MVEIIFSNPYLIMKKNFNFKQNFRQKVNKIEIKKKIKKKIKEN